MKSHQSRVRCAKPRRNYYRKDVEDDVVDEAYENQPISANGKVVEPTSIKIADHGPPGREWISELKRRTVAPLLYAVKTRGIAFPWEMLYLIVTFAGCVNRADKRKTWTSGTVYKGTSKHDSGAQISRTLVFFDDATNESPATYLDEVVVQEMLGGWKKYIIYSSTRGFFSESPPLIELHPEMTDGNRRDENENFRQRGHTTFWHSTERNVFKVTASPGELGGEQYLRADYAGTPLRGLWRFWSDQVPTLLYLHRDRREDLGIEEIGGAHFSGGVCMAGTPPASDCESESESDEDCEIWFGPGDCPN